MCVAPRGFAASAFAEAETTRESQLRLGAAKYAIGENNTASLTQGRICLHPRTDHDHHHHPRFPRRTRSCCSSFPLSLSGKVSSLEKARAPKCKEIAHVICTKPPFKKKRWKKKFVLFSKTVEKRKKKKKKKERRDKKQREIEIEIPLFPLLFLFSSLSCLVCLSVWFLEAFQTLSYFAPFCLQS